MLRNACIISYDGTDYYGWQSQKTSKNTLQEKIETSLSIILNETIEIVGCGRTDSGVHAKGYLFHFDVSHEFDAALIVYKLNKMLGSQIVVHDCFKVSNDFHARFDATSRSYIYRIKKGKDPFDNRFAWEYLYNDELNLDRLNNAANSLLKYNDFFTFCKTRTDVKTTLCTITKSEWILDEKSNAYEFHISADRFLRGMIRLIVGACLNINRGKLTMEQLEHSLKNGKRLPLDWSVPAKGLTLHQISYNL